MQFVFSLAGSICNLFARNGFVQHKFIFCPRFFGMGMTEEHFVSTLAWYGFSQQKFRYILYSPCHGRSFVNTGSDVLEVIGWVRSTQIEIYFGYTN